MVIQEDVVFLVERDRRRESQFQGQVQKFINQEGDTPQMEIYFSKWICEMSKNYYHAIEGFVYQQEEISDILNTLGQILQTSTQLQSKGISLYSQLRKLISIDLPIHLQKIIQVVLQAFDTVLIDSQQNPNQLFEFVEFKTLNSINNLINQLQSITRKDYGKKCSSKKGILLINSFLMILLPLCDQKWQFLHENIINSILDKLKYILDEQKFKLHMWDYYHLFLFFYQLAQGKIRSHVMFDTKNNITQSNLKDKINKLKRVADQCRGKFQNKLTVMYYNQILSFVPQSLWQFKKYAQIYEKTQKKSLKPTIFSIQFIFKYQQFYKQLQFRLSKQHYQYIGIQFYQYFIYILQYILFWSYHDKGKNQKVFTLYKKQQKLLHQAKQLFNIHIQQNQKIKNNNHILKLSNFTKNGLERFVLDVYFLTEIYKNNIIENEKVKCDDFLYKVAMILAKQLKNQPLQTKKDNYNDLLKQFVNIYEKQPEIMKKYMNQKKSSTSRVQSNANVNSNNSSSNSNQNKNSSRISNSKLSKNSNNSNSNFREQSRSNISSSHSRQN